MAAVEAVGSRQHSPIIPGSVVQSYGSHTCCTARTGTVRTEHASQERERDVLLQAGSYTNYFADALIAEAELDSRVVGIHAAMGGGTGMNRFEQRFPERTFDVGIAEQVTAGCPAHVH